MCDQCVLDFFSRSFTKAAPEIVIIGRIICSNGCTKQLLTHPIAYFSSASSAFEFFNGHLMSTVLILPGHGNFGAGHWQTEWERVHPECKRVMQTYWETPDCAAWFERLESAVANHQGDVVFAAHSLGCLLVAYWAERTAYTIKGALLVAPPDPQGVAFPNQSLNFSAHASRSFAFTSVVVASMNDVYGSFGFATQCAQAWGSALVNVGDRGHINSESGLGEWPEGWALLADWL